MSPSAVCNENLEWYNLQDSMIYSYNLRESNRIQSRRNIWRTLGNVSTKKKYSPTCSVMPHSLRPVACSPPGSSVVGFSRQEYRSGLPCPPLGDLPDPGIEPSSPALQADSLPCEPKKSILERKMLMKYCFRGSKLQNSIWSMVPFLQKKKYVYIYMSKMLTRYIPN